jgi:glycosyltransferase involved in cell wall biosynthesis
MLAPQPFFTPRGTPFSVLYRLRALSRLGHEVDLLTYHIGDSPKIPGVVIHRIPRVPGVRSVRIGPSLMKILLDGLLLVQAAWLAQENSYDLIHTHEEAGLMGVALSRIMGVPHLYDMHSSLPQQFGNFGAYNIGPVVGFFRLIEWATLAGADGVITICPDLARHVEESTYAGPHRLIENSYTDEPDETAVRTLAEELRRTHGLEGRRVVLYTGTLEAYQGLDLLVEAARTVISQRPDVTVVVVGGHPDQVEDLRRLVRAAGLEKTFVLTGQVAPAQIPAWLRLSGLLVSPRSTGTNSPLKIYQYLKSGVPLVATAIRSHTQILHEGICRLTPPTPAGLADGLLALLDDPVMARGLAAAAEEKARQEYANEVYVGKMAEMLEAVMSPNGRRQAARAL